MSQEVGDTLALGMNVREAETHETRAVSGAAVALFSPRRVCIALGPSRRPRQTLAALDCFASRPAGSSLAIRSPRVDS